MLSVFFPFRDSVPPSIRLFGSRWQYKPFSGRYVTDSNVDMLGHVRKGRLGNRTSSQTPLRTRRKLTIQQLRPAHIHSYAGACRRRTWGNNEIGREDYWRRLCPVKALTERIPPSAAQRDQITSSLTLRMVQSKFQQCRLHINYMVLRSKEPVSIEHGKDFGRKLKQPHALLTLATGTGETRKLYRSEANNLSPSF